ncbi:MAG: hypothetical protein JHC66_05515 [Acidimicrobiia bacterium]|nr:hypothetical protein [Acidimicrobiia bacterium]
MNQPLRPGSPPTQNKATRGDVRFLVTTALAIVVIGCSIAAILWVLTGRSGDPKGDSKKTTVFSAGEAKALETQIEEGGPVFFADVLAGSKGFWLDSENGKLVALSVNAPGKRDCSVRWRGSIGNYVDCDKVNYKSIQLLRFESNIATTGNEKGLFIVDLRSPLPAIEAPPR